MLFREWPRVVTDYGILRERALPARRSNRKIKLKLASVRGLVYLFDFVVICAILFNFAMQRSKSPRYLNRIVGVLPMNVVLYLILID